MLNDDFPGKKKSTHKKTISYKEFGLLEFIHTKIIEKKNYYAENIAFTLIAKDLSLKTVIKNALRIHFISPLLLI